MLNSNNLNERKQEVIHEADLVPVAAHRCAGWTDWWSQLNRNGYFVTFLDAEFEAGSDVPPIESVSAFVLIFPRIVMNGISEVISGNDRNCIFPVHTNSIINR
jgi:hypothetical protein